MARIKYLWSSEELIAEGKRHRDTKQVLLDLVWRSTDHEDVELTTKSAKNLGFRSIEQPLCGYPDQGYGRHEVLIVKVFSPFVYFVLQIFRRPAL